MNTFDSIEKEKLEGNSAKALNEKGSHNTFCESVDETASSSLKKVKVRCLKKKVNKSWIKVSFFLLLCFIFYALGSYAGIIAHTYLNNAVRDVVILSEKSEYKIPAKDIEYFTLAEKNDSASSYIQLEDGTIQHFTVEKSFNGFTKIKIRVSEVNLRNLEKYKKGVKKS